MPAGPKPSKADHRDRQKARLAAIRLRVVIAEELEARGIATDAGVGEALGMPPAEAVALLRRKAWRRADLALLRAALLRLVDMPV